jgi:hypothetical protein
MSRGDDQRRAQPGDFVLQPVDYAYKAIQPKFKQIRWLVHSNSEIELSGRRDDAHYPGSPAAMPPGIRSG